MAAINDVSGANDDDDDDGDDTAADDDEVSGTRREGRGRVDVGMRGIDTL